jgi:O-antigen/teichoic acid export membrane protein
MTPDTEVPLQQVRTRAVRGVASLLLRQGAVTLIALAGLLVLARIITPEMFGLFVTAQLAQLMCEQLGGLGLMAALVRQKQPVSEAEFRTVFTLQLLASMIAALLIGLSAPAALELLGIDTRHQWLVWVMALSGVIAAFQTVPSVLLQRSLTFERIAVGQVLQQVAYQVTAVVLAILGFEAWSLVIASIVKSAVGAFVLSAYAPWQINLGIDRAAIRRLVPFGFLIQLNGAAGIANNATIPLIVGYSLGTAAVGQVNFARKLLDALGYQPLIMTGQVQLRVFGRVQDDDRRLRESLERSILVGGAFVLGLLALLAALAEPLVHLVFTDKWLPAVPVIQLLCIGYAIHVAMYPVMQLLKATGDSATPLLSSTLRFVAEASLFIALAGGLDLAAYGLAYILANLGSVAFGLWRLPSAHRPNLLESLVPVAVPAVVAGLVAWLIAGDTRSVFVSVAGLLAGIVVLVTALGVFVGARLGHELRQLFASLVSSPGVHSRALSLLWRALERLDCRAWRSTDRA